MRFLRKARVKELGGVALLRLDFNTEDEWRMAASLPTVNFLRERARCLVIVSHRGRPEGVRFTWGVPEHFDKKLSLREDAKALSRLIDRTVVFVPHFRFEDIKRQISESPKGSVLLLENMRFLPGEEKNDAKFARELASLADYYVNDAFAVSHRANASIVAVTKLLPSYAGLGLEGELAALTKVMKSPKRPFVVIIGGAKVQDKIGVISSLRRVASTFLVGSGPARSLLQAKGERIGKDIFPIQPKELPAIRRVAKYKNLVLPVDYVIHERAVRDVGRETLKQFDAYIAKARTIIWNGPLGFIEQEPYEQGTLHIAKAIGENKKAFSIAGGGETVMFLKQYKLDTKFSFVSTGGGAMLDFLAGKKLPGIIALERSK
ncbi:MAG: phosphoglycerate kinase [bacterium]|nr:phosphoglycerate kinase [bacterium]